MPRAAVSTKTLDWTAKRAEKSARQKQSATRDAAYRWVACNHGQPETHLFRCLTPMFVQQMSIHFANENPAILVA